MVYTFGFLIALMWIGGGSLTVTHIVAPDYPPLARAAKIEGTVRLDLEVGVDGKVLAATGSGAHQLLVDEAARNIRLWTFVLPPGMGNGSIRHTLHYTYKLEGEATDPAPAPRVTFDLPDHVEIVTKPPKLYVIYGEVKRQTPGGKKNQ